MLAPLQGRRPAKSVLEIWLRVCGGPGWTSEALETFGSRIRRPIGAEVGEGRFRGPRLVPEKRKYPRPNSYQAPRGR
jgi:hypothetical protein